MAVGADQRVAVGAGAAGWIELLGAARTADALRGGEERVLFKERTCRVRFLGRQRVATVRAGQWRAEHRLMAKGALAREESIASGAL